MSLKPIVQALGGDLYAGGWRANIPGPGHSRQDRSVSLLLVDDRVIVNSFGRSDWREVLADLRSRGLIDADGRPNASRGSSSSAHAGLPDTERTAVAGEIWAGANALGRSLGAAYVGWRGILRPAPVSAALRHHAGLPSAIYIQRGRRRPALVAAIRDADGALTAVEVTYIDPSGCRAVGMRTPRKTVGIVPTSSAVRLDPAGAELLVGEGVFTTLSAADHFGLPGWALLSTRNLRTWIPPDEVRQIVLAADRGHDGERSAAVLAGRLGSLGRAVRVELPPWPAADWNEAFAQSNGSGSADRERR